MKLRTNFSGASDGAEVQPAAHTSKKIDVITILSIRASLDKLLVFEIII
jgi:hypothetical protein